MREYWKNRNIVLWVPLLVTVVIGAVITGTLMVTSLSRSRGNSSTSFLCTFAAGFRSQTNPSDTTPNQFLSLLHYATSRAVPQQTASEIRVTFDVLQLLYPCNFLIFGLGHDSLLWSSLNPRGTTLFLEEDIKWVHQILTNGPSLRVLPVHYNTRLSDSDQLLKTYKSKQHCVPPDVYLKGNTRCKLALSDLPDEVYNKQWDVILIDGPRGYYPETPGRMASIFTAAVMARTRVRPGVTHVILHDVDRKVEKEFANEFLCAKYRVQSVDKLWHFQIPPASKWSTGKLSTSFC